MVAMDLQNGINALQTLAQIPARRKWSEIHSIVIELAPALKDALQQGHGFPRIARELRKAGVVISKSSLSRHWKIIQTSAPQAEDTPTLLDVSGDSEGKFKQKKVYLLVHRESGKRLEMAYDGLSQGKKHVFSRVENGKVTHKEYSEAALAYYEVTPE